MRSATPIQLTARERSELESILRAEAPDSRLGQRIRLVLLAADGLQNKEIAQRLGVGRIQVARWRERYAQDGLEGVRSDRPRGAPPVKLDRARLAELVADSGAGGWTTRKLASELGVSPASVSRHLRAQPAESQPSDRLTPPKLPRGLQPREALMARLLEARRQRCIVLQGEAGSGKTTTLLVWRKALLALDYDVAWLALEPADNDVPRFLAGLRACLDAPARDPALPAGAGLEQEVIALVKDIARRPRELVLMLDALQAVTDARIHQLLQWLVDYAPPQLHLALATRAALPLALEQLRAQGLSTALDMRDLCFGPEESVRFLRERLGAIAAPQAEALHALTGGWVAALALFAADPRSAREDPPTLLGTRGGAAFAAYLQDEVLAKLAPGDLDLLTRTSVCVRLCAPLCAALLGQPATASRLLKARLERLRQQGFFLTRSDADGAEPWYRLQPLLREVLAAGVAAWTPAAQRALHAAAAAWFGARGQVEESVRHAVSAGNAAEAATLVEGSAFELLASGDEAMLARLLRLLPQSEVQARVDLLIATGYLHYYTRDLESFGAMLARLEAEGSKLDALQRYSLLIMRAALDVHNDDYAAVLAAAPAVRAIPFGASDLAWSSRGNVLAWLHIANGEYEQAGQAIDEGDRVAAPSRSGLLARCRRALVLAQLGEVRQAERLAREVLDQADAQGPSYDSLACTAATLLAGMLYEMGDPEAARQLLEVRLDAIERLAVPDMVLRAHQLLSSAHAVAGRVNESLAALNRLDSYAGRHGLHRLLAMALNLRLRRLLPLGELGQAHALLQRIEALGQRHASADARQTSVFRAAATHGHVEICLHLRDFEGAQAGLRGLLAEFETGGQQRTLALLRMQLAVAEHGLGRLGAAREELLAALRQGHRHGLVRSLLDASPAVPALLELLLGAGAPEPVLAFYAERLRAVAARPVSGQASAPAATGATAIRLSEREREVLGLLGQAMTYKKIARVLEVSPNTVKWHLKQIYAKLGVNDRDGAVARLRDGGAAPPARLPT